MAIPVYEALSADINHGNLTRLCEGAISQPNKGDRPMTKFEVAVKFVKNDEVMKNYTNVMVLLLRLRQGGSTITTDYTVCTYY
jgi:hypothetical protein